ncbi:TPR domain protein, putative component of TonB system [uncultured Candidatus Thioglobus sp.]|nr:TPR domain protein, putative component of TonB system [uncultured Candidatus Thioglobus sp.]
MKKIILLMFLTLSAHANLNTDSILALDTKLNLQNQATDAKFTLQNQKIQSLENQLNSANQYQDLRKQVLDSQESSIDWWWPVIGIFLAIFGVILPFVFFFFNKQYRKDAKEKIDTFEKETKNLEKQIEKSEALERDAKELLNKIKEHEKGAKEGNKKVQEAVKNIEKNPEKDVSEEDRSIIKESNNAFAKKMLKARQLQAKGENKNAIKIWESIVNSTDSKEQTASAYFNIGYLYDELDGKDNLQKAIDAYQKAIEIKPDDHEAYYNMGIAYNKLSKHNKAIDFYNKAIDINQHIGKDIERSDWDILSNTIKQLKNQTQKQQYSNILKRLKKGL